MWRNLLKGKGRWWRNEKKVFKKSEKKRREEKSERDGGGERSFRTVACLWPIEDGRHADRAVLMSHKEKNEKKKKKKKRKDWFNTFRHCLRSRRMQSSWAFSKGSSSRQQYVPNRCSTNWATSSSPSPHQCRFRHERPDVRGGDQFLIPANGLRNEVP